jgi:hypothetical protein
VVEGEIIPGAAAVTIVVIECVATTAAIGPRIFAGSIPRILARIVEVAVVWFPTARHVTVMAMETIYMIMVSSSRVDTA